MQDAYSLECFQEMANNRYPPTRLRPHSRHHRHRHHHRHRPTEHSRLDSYSARSYQMLHERSRRSTWKGDHGLRSRHGRSHSKLQGDSRYDSSDAESDVASVDCFGCISYKSPDNLLSQSEALRDRCNYQSTDNENGNNNNKKNKNNNMKPNLDIPWQLRESVANPVCTYFDFLGTKHFWFLIQFAARVTFIGMLIPTIIISLNEGSEHLSPTYTLPAVNMGADLYVGGSAMFLVQFIKAGCIWIPVSTACIAVGLRDHFVAWVFVYLVTLFLVACFTENISRRICLLLINVTLVGHLNGATSLTFPSHMFVNWVTGLLFALASTLVPFPVLATRSARSTSRRLCMNTATAFRGLSTCFWATSNTERSMEMVRIRRITHSLDLLIEKLDVVERLTFYECFFFDSFECRTLRLEKTKLLDELRLNLRSVMRVINIVQDKPHIIDNSSRCIQFGTSLSRPMEGISRCVEELLDGLGEARKRKDFVKLSPLFDACGRNIKKLQEEFGSASKILFYEKKHKEEMEEFVPLMTFFVFSVVNFWYTLDTFHHHICIEKEAKIVNISCKKIWEEIKRPFCKKIDFVKQLVLRREEREVRVVIEAGKVSTAMLIALLFFCYVQPNILLLSGPTIIAFLSGGNPVQAVQMSVVRLTGTLLGSVIGFFAASLCHTKIDFIVSLCVITFVLTFFRTGEKYGPVCAFANFIAIPSLSLQKNSTADLIITRIQQNSFAIIIYCFIVILVFPISPGKLLMKKRMNVLQIITDVMGIMMDFYREPLQSNDGGHHFMRGGGGYGEEYMQNDWMFAAMNPQRRKKIHNNNEGGEEENDNKNISRIYVPTFIVAPEPDSRVSSLLSKVWYLRQEMAETAHIMPFAADERGIKPFIYPQKACEAIHTALYRIFALVYTMVCSWKLMRDKGYFTPEVRRIMRYVYPLTRDIHLSLQRFVNMLVFYIVNPSSSLALELTKGLLQFRALVSELAWRQHFAIDATISEAVQRQQELENRERNVHTYTTHNKTNNNNNNNNNNSSSNYSSTSPSSDHDEHRGRTSPMLNLFRMTTRPHNNNNTVKPSREPLFSEHEESGGGKNNNFDKTQNDAARAGGRGQSEKEPLEHSQTLDDTLPLPLHLPSFERKRRGDSHTVNNNNDNNEGRNKNKKRKQNRGNHSRNKRHPHVQFSEGNQGSELHRPADTPTDPSAFPVSIQHSEIDESNYINDDLSPAPSLSLSSSTSSSISVHFSDSFTMPITVHDAEGLHSISLALDMMGKEMRNVLLAFEDMVQMKNH